jgi:hypothetical protein
MNVFFGICGTASISEKSRPSILKQAAERCEVVIFLATEIAGQ